MALLSGFGCISSPWQSFTVRPKPVTETDVRRIQSGLEATAEMLETKRNKLAQLERKLNAKASPWIHQDNCVVQADDMLQSTQDGFMTKMMSSIRGDNDTREVSALRLEISGLATMQQSLSNDLASASARLEEQSRSHT